MPQYYATLRYRQYLGYAWVKMYSACFRLSLKNNKKKPIQAPLRYGLFSTVQGVAFGTQAIYPLTLFFAKATPSPHSRLLFAPAPPKRLFRYATYPICGGKPSLVKLPALRGYGTSGLSWFLKKQKHTPNPRRYTGASTRVFQTLSRPSLPSSHWQAHAPYRMLRAFGWAGY